jgi:hypothetical protein
MTNADDNLLSPPLLLSSSACSSVSLLFLPVLFLFLLRNHFQRVANSKVHILRYSSSSSFTFADVEVSNESAGVSLLFSVCGETTDKVMTKGVVSLKM